MHFIFVFYSQICPRRAKVYSTLNILLYHRILRLEIVLYSCVYPQQIDAFLVILALTQLYFTLYNIRYIN